MSFARFSRHYARTAVLLAMAGPAWAQTQVQDSSLVQDMPVVQVLGTAEEEVKESLGVSVITAEEIQRRPPVNDLADIIRREPGVNLTGNSASGARGNNRQIDIRGMGPENTLILVDGKPVSSRNSVRYGWNGDRDTRGDSNWVPAEEVERIEVIRGPAAARYGSGAMGGVVNIITKRPTDKTSASATYYINQPEDSKEGNTNRVNFSLATPVSDTLSMRLYGNYNKTNPDARDINAGHAAPGTDGVTSTAGREGVINQDLNTLFSWKMDKNNTFELDAGFSRQGNLYAGDTMNNANSVVSDAMYGEETNIMYRDNVSLTHRGSYDWGTSRASIGYDYTRNTRREEGLAGGPEGAPTGNGFATARLKNWRAAGEVNLPFTLGVSQVATLGVEYLRESLDDPSGLRQTYTGGSIAGTDAANRDAKAKQNSYALFVEDNIEATQDVTLTPGLRLDHNSEFGNNWSPSLNASWAATDAFRIKGGIARAYKAPNLYQSNPNYLLYSRGQGCLASQANSNGCYLVGNENLSPEISVNKEIGFEYDPGTWRTSMAYFRNDYKNKIVAGTDVLYRMNNGARVLQWTNSGKAVVEGLEGNLFVPLADNLDWNTNFTYMIESKNKSTGQPLSVIPKYTINSTLDWFYTEQLSFQANVTYYGKQQGPSVNERTGVDLSGDALQTVSPYALVGLSAGYEVNKNLRLRVGVSNLFDKKQYREGNASSAGAATYNEPGRAYYATLTVSY
ncbi:TonB-dependent siderophore receptor [Bordetella pseudohinzii]|uniref:Enterobactin outer-membrane receptor n=1 Tax=Bordetella pseudohinzii TaxID=1331258 RepID=A0A0J6C7H2_9BORD|nr:TonB-dependent siderophore receptor [Bordetella pseudohinzii]ANY16227.1 outer membrane receptor protein [Bordetella pseudohinzii]KMM25277.1 outer membrane receptor protein [Bordetella pseudohinzii]KXA78640.1 outer membrane receptor protein [Bordetella pseudohinzii]KXA81172.1 outer membrane receptor protein [Bordetella pseudohinzii]CUJ05603.1 Enterobactin outer-membrane receptor [Bordetella pseudohinzii]